MHMRPIHTIFFITISFFLLSCEHASKDIHETRFMMGTLVSFTIVHPNKDIAMAAIRKAAQEMQRIEDTFTIYGSKPNSIKAFNQLSIHTSFHFPSEVNRLLETALDIEQQSDGAFSPTLATLNKLWGFSNTEPPNAPPSPSSIQKLLSSTQNCLQHNGKQWLRTTPNCQLDFGAIAKGYAIDRGIEVLKNHGIQHAMINAGGDIRLIGKHGKNDWHIGIRDPRHKGSIIATLSLHGDVSIVTSGDYERYFINNGQRYHHILNPKTGLPSYNSQSTTVIASNATLADAWSTALFVLGKEGIKIAETLPLQALIIDSSGQMHHTKAMPINLRPNP